MQQEFTNVVTIAAILIIGLFVVSMTYGTMPASDFNSVANESITVDHGNTTQVDETYGVNYYENETVYNSSGAVLTEGTDYEWYPSNQSIYWYNTAATTDGSTANVTYYFDARPASARQSIGTISQAFVLGAVAVIVLVAALILALISGFGGGGGGGGKRGGGRL